MATSMPKTKANNKPYRKVKISMWDDTKFQQLSPLPPSGQSLFIYLLTGPCTGIIPGLFRAGRAAMAEELGWDIEDYDLALGELITLGMVKADLKARLFWVPNAAKHNAPNSGNVVKAWANAFNYLPECELKWEAYEVLQAACYGVSKAMGKAFDMAMPLPKDKPNALPSGIQKAVNSKQILEDKNTLSDSIKQPNRTDDDPPDSIRQAFEKIFWPAGLRKAAKAKTLPAFEKKYRAWKKTNGGPPDVFARMLAEDIRLRLSARVFGFDKLLPASYLNGERWNDERPGDGLMVSESIDYDIPEGFRGR